MAGKQQGLCLPAIYTSRGSESGYVVECGYNFSNLDTKNLGTPFSNSNSNQAPNGTAATTPLNSTSPGATNTPGGYSAPPATTNGSPGWSPNSTTNGAAPRSEWSQEYSAPDDDLRPQPVPNGGIAPHPKTSGVRGALRPVKQALQNNFQNNQIPMQNNGGAVYPPAQSGNGQPSGGQDYFGHPQMMPPGYGVSVRDGPRNGELGGDIDQDAMNRHYQDLKQREATGAMNPVMGDILKNSSPEMRAKLMQMYQQKHAAPLAAGQEPTTPEEMVKVGLYIEREKQISKLPQAIEYFRKAAEAGFSPGMCLLADRYQTGVREVLQPDQDKAYYWWSKAAAKGERLALFAMGSYYLNGDHVPKNQTKAFQYFLQSAQKGFNAAKLTVGQAYVCGEGVVENRQQALKWLEEANNGGSPEAGSWLFMLKLKNCPNHFANRQAFLNYGYAADATWKANQAAGGNANNARIKAIGTPYGSIEHTQAVNQLRTNTMIEERTRQQLNTQF
jgi:TPR repeat protein